MDSETDEASDSNSSFMTSASTLRGSTDVDKVPSASQPGEERGQEGGEPQDGGCGGGGRYGSVVQAPLAEDCGAGNLSFELSQLLDSHMEEIERDTIQLLQKLIQIDTQNFEEEGSEMKAVRLLEEVFGEAGVEYEIVEPKPGRGNIVARIRGDGCGEKRALLLSAHLDTVKAPRENWEEEGWKHDPYGGVIDEQDGCMYGRGTIDMKQMAAMSVTLLCFVKKHNIVLSRDLIFAGVADEERTDSKWGAKYLVENRPELIEADIVFNEVGGFTTTVQGIESVIVQIAEKGSMQVRITAHGPGGHGSLYHKTNPLATIGEIVNKLHTTKLPLRVNVANTATVESLAAALPFPKSVVFRRLLNPYFSDIIMNRLVPPNLQSSIGPLLRNTANPTSIGGGGGQHNQIPTSAWAMVDSRILPECTPDDVIEDIKHVIGPQRFVAQEGPSGNEDDVIPAELSIEVLKSRGPCFQDPCEAVCSGVLGTMRDVLAKRLSGAHLCTVLIPGATDSYWYSRHPSRTPICLGFTPVKFAPDMKFSDLFHGTNERIPIEGYKWGIGVFTDVVYMVCGARTTSQH